ncbi:MAG: tRNA-dihydrouridine synthase family protein, partial [Spirochaetaceae bacterium]|nr:tRNA-dihydrouridine synthase family protein [Spirochaetaceae bacterium]
MVALSHRPLRTIVREFGGLDVACTEMTSAAGLVSGSEFDEVFMDAGPEPERTMLQFYTIKEERLVQALELCADRKAMGADINFGCAAPHIERSGGGAAWMQRPREAAALVAAARRAWARPLSAKLRIGEEEDYDALRDFCLGLVDAGLDFVTLHPRLTREKFRRSSRWDFVGRLASELPVPVVGNGDVRGYSDWRERTETAKPAGIMIGREAVRRPWIFALIRGLEADPGFRIEIDLASVAARMLGLLEEILPPEYRLTRARRFFYYFCDNFSFSHHIKWKMQNAPDLDAMRRELSLYLTEAPADRVKEYRD